MHIEIFQQPKTPIIDPAFVDSSELVPQPKTGPIGSDVHPLRADFETPAYSGEVDPNRAIDVLLGERVTLMMRRGIPGMVWELARRPASSKAAVDSGRLVPDVAGLYVVALTLPGNWRREILVAAFPEDALDLTVYPPRMGLERRMRLRGVLHDPLVTRDTIIAGLEGPTIDLATLAGYGGKKRGAFDVTRYR